MQKISRTDSLLIMKSKPTLLVVFILIFLTYSVISSPRSTPDQSILYLFKRGQEKVFMKLELTMPGRAKYMISLLDQRLLELQKIVEKKKIGYVLETASRYSTWAGRTTDFILENDLTEQKDLLLVQLTKHREVLEQIYDKYPKNTDDREYKYIEDDINYLELYMQKLQNVQLPS